jgi:soluble lytic murein transglycosylase
MNAILLKDEPLAIKILDKAYEKAYYTFDKDKVDFWRFQLTQDSKYLDNLANSIDINIYTIFAKEMLGIEINNAIYDIEIDTNSTTSNYDTTDPFEWIKVLSLVKYILS